MSEIGALLAINFDQAAADVRLALVDRGMGMVGELTTEARGEIARLRHRLKAVKRRRNGAAQLEAAADELVARIRLEPRDWLAHYQLVEYRWAQGDRERALAASAARIHARDTARATVQWVGCPTGAFRGGA